MRRSLLIGLNTALATAAIVGVGAPAQALITVFTDQTSFLNAIQPGAYTENFNSFSRGTPPSSSFSRLGFGFTASAPGGLWIAQPPAAPTDRSLSVNSATDTLTLNNFVGSPTAIGGFFFLSDISDNIVSDSSMEVTVTDGVLPVTRLLTNPTSTTFLGFVSDAGAITSVAMRVPTQPSGQFRWVGTDDFTVGKAAVPVPAPPMGVMGVVGLVLPWLRSRLKTLIKSRL